MAGHLRQVAYPEAQILQRRRCPQARRSATTPPGPRPADTEVAILNLGYADGYRARFRFGRGGGGWGAIAGTQAAYRWT